MKVLFLAPQPFFQVRGTPIAVRLLLEFFSRRGWQADVLVFAEGEDVSIPGARFFRVPRLPLVRRIRPGFSPAKLACDGVMFSRALALARGGGYDYVHCVEESVFMGMAIGRRHGLPFVYDMDSSLAEQMAEKHRIFRLVLPLLRRCEDAALRRAAAVLAVCDALAETARRAARGPVLLLRDPPLTPPGDPAAAEALRNGWNARGPVFVYVGNLEGYQGIDLLLEAFRRVRAGGTEATLVVIGGEEADIAKYREVCRRGGILDDVRFPGPCPPARAADAQAAADVLVSPRLKGRNTPMKIYSYLQAGRPVLATDIFSHTQVLTPEAALLTAPEPAAFAEGLRRLATDPALRQRLGAGAAQLSASAYSRAAYEKAAGEFCAWMEQFVATRPRA